MKHIPKCLKKTAYPSGQGGQAVGGYTGYKLQGLYLRIAFNITQVRR